MEMLWLAPGGRTPPQINAYVYHTVSQDHEMEAGRNSSHLRISDDFFLIFSCFFMFFSLFYVNNAFFLTRTGLNDLYPRKKSRGIRKSRSQEATEPATRRKLK